MTQFVSSGLPILCQLADIVAGRKTIVEQIRCSAKTRLSVSLDASRVGRGIHKMANTCLIAGIKVAERDAVGTQSGEGGPSMNSGRACWRQRVLKEGVR